MRGRIRVEIEISGVGPLEGRVRKKRADGSLRGIRCARQPWPGFLARKNPCRDVGTGSDSIMWFGFPGGDGARVHRVDCSGGVPGCAARCRDDLAHSLPQVMSALRNLITVFSTVNNISQIFSPCRPLPDGGGRHALLVAGPQQQHARAVVKIVCVKKRRVLGHLYDTHET